MLDTVIVGGNILDGTGASARRADIGIRDGRIARIGDLSREKSATRIDADGRMVSPGFIDAHSHDDFNLHVNPLVPGKTVQGVTTQVTGNCGWSPAPLLPENRALFIENASFLDSGLSYDWQGMGEFLDSLPPMGVNVAQLVGHVTVRCAAMGVEDRPPTPAELKTMRHLVEQSMKQGAFGFSTGLIYPPSAFANTDEIVELAKVTAKFGGTYHTHMRNEGQHIFESVDEAAEIGRRAGIHVQISHLKLAGKTWWGQAEKLLAHIAAHQKQGLSINCDQYPYPAGSSGLKSLLPNWAHAGGTEALLARLRNPVTRDQIRAEMLEGMSERGFMKIAKWNDVMIAESQGNPANNGFDLTELSARDGKPPVDVLLDMLVQDYAKTLALFFTIGVEDMERILRHPDISVGSDGIITSRPGREDLTKPHPRYYGTFPRVLGRYVREAKLLDLPAAVRKMTHLPAQALGIQDRGRLQEGLAADVVIFDSTGITDLATYKEPLQAPTGISHVFVNGVLVAQDGRETGAAPGVILKRQGAAA